MPGKHLTNRDADKKAAPLGDPSVQPPASPGTDPTNPHNQEPTGEWVANERASDRRNAEPGMTDADRKQRSV
jgi:hypothetical protein